MNTTSRNRRVGFSLLEVMLATAILASSAMVLSSLLGLGAKYGSRAEARTEALSQAQSLLAEFLAMPREAAEQESERTGLLNSNPLRSFRIRMVEASPSGGDNAGMASSSLAMAPQAMAPQAMAPQAMSAGAGYGDDSMASAFTGSLAGSSVHAPQPSRLVLVTVEVFESASAEAATTQAPISRLSQLVRTPAVEKP